MAATPPTGEATQGESSAAAAPAGSTETPLPPALRGPGQQRRRPKSLSRVTWDEEAIKEHDKERGTRQKIDEVDTPFPRSPQTNSDDELDMLQNISDRPDAKASVGPPRNHLLPTAALDPAPASAAAPSAASPSGDVCPVALADRLNRWVRSEEGSRQRRSSTSSASSADSTRKASMERRVSLEGLPSPRQGTLDFKAKRAQHYNEGAAMKAALGKTVDTGSDDEGPVSPKELADRLDKLVKRGGGSRSSASSASSDSGRRYSMERRVSLEEQNSPRHGTSDFKTKRALHYNEGAAMKAALMRLPSDDDDDEDSEKEEGKSDNDDKETKKGAKEEKKSVSTSAAAAAVNLSLPPTSAADKKECHATVTTDASPRPPSNDFRQRRAQHYNEGAAIKAFRNRKAQIGSDEESDEDGPNVGRHVSLEAAQQPKVASAGFKAKRAQHYNEGSALRAAMRSSFESSESSGSSSDDSAAKQKSKAKNGKSSSNSNININGKSGGSIGVGAGAAAAAAATNGPNSNRGNTKKGSDSDSDSDTNKGKTKPNSGA
eukprot:CAMPEP_0206458938 /NCGR_PEP_ID=MMETSP0324_2-20121206/23873_1 /ASSEMBLY_ACC=CAM_ASM_000836 /TAXON_ID=2866 /ORGANISM="Crypthecodinium cohnii, Strain Seligo" /LENGTH=545 /DNA_ID=CAMNT_0053930383 /DNA_START=774 /DNA_END=2407 /DNA_ORIENTATION=+